MKKLSILLLFMLSLNACVVTTGIVGFAVGSNLVKRKDVQTSISDTKISAVIKARFLDKGFHDLYKKINVEVLFGRVFLIGYVASQKDISQALKIVWDTEGVKDVVNEIKVSEHSNYFDAKQYVIDTYITSAVRTRLFGKADVSSFSVTVTTQNNVVYLFGNVESHEQLDEITSIVSYTKGVSKVKSYVIVN